MGAAVDTPLEAVGNECAGMIQSEQRRLLATQHPQLTDKIACKCVVRSKDYIKFSLGYDSQTIRDNFELLIIEFGRPGKSARCSGEYEKKLRPATAPGVPASSAKKRNTYKRKGAFPSSISHIRAGYDIAAHKAADTLNNRLADIAAQRFMQQE